MSRVRLGIRGMGITVAALLSLAAVGWADAAPFTGHTDTVYSVAFSPDGTMALTGSWDKTAKLWNASTGALIRTFAGHTRFVTSAAFSPDGTMILIGKSNTAALWPTTGESEGEGEGEISAPTEVKLRDLLTADFDTVDGNGDGLTSYIEALAALPGLTQEVFNAVDANSDGQINSDEAGQNVDGGCAGGFGDKGAFVLDKVKNIFGNIFLGRLSLTALLAASRQKM